MRTNAKHVTVAIVGAMLLCSVARASVPEHEGSSIVGFGAVWRSIPMVGQPARLLFSMTGSVDTSAVGVARIVLPAGIRLIEGDTLYTGRPVGRLKYWSIVVMPERVGAYTISARLRVDHHDGNGTEDELDLALRFVAHRDTAEFGPSELTRLETIRLGKRFRYGGRFLIPLGAPEYLTQSDLERNGTRATVRSKSSGLCSGCATGGGVDVPCIVFVGGDGAARGVHFLRPHSPEVERAVRSAINKWVFMPARFKGQAVSDWIKVTVHVSSEH